MYTLLALLTLLPPAIPDSARVQVSMALLPESFWSPTFGFGFGLRIKTRPEHVGITIAPAQRRQWMALTWRARRFTSRLHLDNNLVRSFYGRGARSTPDQRVRWHLLTVRFGLQYPLHALRLSFVYRWDRSFPPDSTTWMGHPEHAYLRLMSRHLLQSRIVMLGGTYINDNRNHRACPTRGGALFTTVRFMQGLRPSSLRAYQVYLTLHRYTAIQQTTLAFRLTLAHTQNSGQTPLPFYLLPTLDYHLLPGFPRYRFTGNDAVVAGLEARRILKTLLKTWFISGSVGIHMGNTYGSLIREWRPWPVWRPRPSNNRPRNPMAMSLSLNVRIFTRDPEKVLLNATLGISAESVSFAAVSFVYHPPIGYFSDL